MFEQIIKNLQKQEKLSNSQTFIIEAKEGRSHNENFAFPSITKSCELWTNFYHSYLYSLFFNIWVCFQRGDFETTLVLS